jgi:hypothetical protein
MRACRAIVLSNPRLIDVKSPFHSLTLVVNEPMRPHLTRHAGEAYIFGVDAFTQRRIVELRSEIAALQHEQLLYTAQVFHTPAEKHSRNLRQERLQAIKQELLRLDKPFQREQP